MLHRRNSKPRWLEEVEAWEYALEQFDRFDLPSKDKAKSDAARSIVYAAAKADRRRCSPETAQAILDRLPEWVWVINGVPCTYMDLSVAAAVES